MLQDQQGHVDLPWSQVGHPFDFDRVLIRTLDIESLNQFMGEVEAGRISKTHSRHSMPCMVEFPEKIPATMLQRLKNFFPISVTYRLLPETSIAIRQDIVSSGLTSEMPSGRVLVKEAVSSAFLARGTAIPDQDGQPSAGPTSRRPMARLAR
jgi:hypothetical protein